VACGRSRARMNGKAHPAVSRCDEPHRFHGRRSLLACARVCRVFAG
jgi:hypothetical protein